MKHRPIVHHNSLRALRRRLGLTQRELAVLVGYETESQIGRLERGSRVPRLLEAFRIELVLGKSLGQIFGHIKATTLRDVMRQVERLNERLLRSGCLQLPRVSYKAGQLANVLASLKRQSAAMAESDQWHDTNDRQEREP